MKYKIYIIGILILLSTSCQNSKTDQTSDQGHSHEDVKQIITEYSEEFELFAKADPFVIGKSANILAHFSQLPDFLPLQNAVVTLRLRVKGNETVQTIKKASKIGIFNFQIIPETEGIGTLFFEIKTNKNEYKIIVQNIEVYDDEHDAIHEIEYQNSKLASTNIVPFTKEQSWKIDFSTDFPDKDIFGEVIKTGAQIRSAQSDEIMISAKTSGIAVFPEEYILEGKAVKKGQNIFTISGNSLADNNTSVKFAEAKNNFIKAESDYEMAKELAKDKIVSQKGLNKAKKEYDNTKFIYNNYRKNFSSSGQNVRSPMSGFVKHLYVQNGEYVEAGQTIISITKNKTLLLFADVQQKYAGKLPFVKTANIRTLHDNKVYSLEYLNGKFLSFGKHTNDDNYLLPISLQIDNTIDLVSGGFVELFLKTTGKDEILTIPNDALVEEQGIFYVFVQLTPEIFEKREVKIGASDGKRTEIVKGINETERIVTKGSVYIKLSEATGGLDAHSGHVH